VGRWRSVGEGILWRRWEGRWVCGRRGSGRGRGGHGRESGRGRGNASDCGCGSGRMCICRRIRLGGLLAGEIGKIEGVTNQTLLRLRDRTR
jgi:hypothetical protein